MTTEDFEAKARKKLKSLNSTDPETPKWEKLLRGIYSDGLVLEGRPLATILIKTVFTEAQADSPLEKDARIVLEKWHRESSDRLETAKKTSTRTYIRSAKTGRTAVPAIAAIPETTATSLSKKEGVLISASLVRLSKLAPGSSKHNALSNRLFDAISPRAPSDFSLTVLKRLYADAPQDSDFAKRTAMEVIRFAAHLRLENVALKSSLRLSRPKNKMQKPE